MDVHIEKNTLDAKTFSLLREDKYFKEYAIKDIEEALKNTLFTVLLLGDNEPVGMGRVVGDGRIAFFIKDVAVKDEYQNQGFGKIIMDYLLSYIEDKGCDNAYIGLMTTPNKEHFYEKFGFIRRPNEVFGSGMVKFLNKY